MNILFLAIFLFKEIVTQELFLCEHRKRRINAKCVLTCKTPGVKMDISFKGQGSTLGYCSVDFDRSTCQPFNNRYLISQNESANESYLTIKNLDKTEDEGTWHCEYGNNQSKTMDLLLHDIISNSSLQPKPKVTEIDGQIRIDFLTNCLMPKPIALLKCKSGDKACKGYHLKSVNCGKPNLRMYNITCNTTSECFRGNTAHVDLTVNGYVIEKVVIHKMESMHNTEGTNTSSHGIGSSVATVTSSVILIISCICMLAISYKYREKIIKACNGRKGKQMGTNQSHEENAEQDMPLN